MAKVQNILPPSVVIHCSLTKHSMMLLNTVTSLLSSANVIDKDAAAEISVSRALNIKDIGELQNLMAPYWASVKKLWNLVDLVCIAGDILMAVTLTRILTLSTMHNLLLSDRGC
eukprot:7268566-Ditylum_brightwellii.AAC.1